MSVSVYWGQLVVLVEWKCFSIFILFISCTALPLNVNWGRADPLHLAFFSARFFYPQILLSLRSSRWNLKTAAVHSKKRSQVFLPIPSFTTRQPCRYLWFLLLQRTNDIVGSLTNKLNLQMFSEFESRHAETGFIVWGWCLGGGAATWGAPIRTIFPRALICLPAGLVRRLKPANQHLRIKSTPL